MAKSYSICYVVCQGYAKAKFDLDKSERNHMRMTLRGVHSDENEWQTKE